MGQLNKFRGIMVCVENYIHDIFGQPKHGNADMVENIPNPLYKYYAINPQYDTQRISGELYFSSPIDFNDPYDCQTDVSNNVKELMKQRPGDGAEWIKGKLHELGFNETELKDLFMRIQKDDRDDRDAIDEIHKKQIEKLGILCLTTNCNNIIMWAYYADNHKGYCLEYDTTDIMRDITMDFINQ